MVPYVTYWMDVEMISTLWTLKFCGILLGRTSRSGCRDEIWYEQRHFDLSRWAPECVMAAAAHEVLALWEDGLPWNDLV